MKINSRIDSGINHATDFARSLPNDAQMSDTIIIGADISHSGSGATIGTDLMAAMAGALDAQGLLYGGSA